MSTLDSGAWQAALAHVPGGGDGAQVTVRPLAGGTANATFKVRTGCGVFVVRLHEPDSADLGVDRRREAVLHVAAAQAGFASQVLDADPLGRYLVTEFLPGTPWSAAAVQDEARLRELAQVLAGLHALPPPAVPPLDLGALLDRHVAHIATLDAVAAQELLPRLAHARRVLARQAAAARPPCIIHGDLSHSNIIGRHPLRLIDWEYAAVGDPLADLACLVAYYPQVRASGAALLQWCDLAASAGLEALDELAGVYRLATDLWYRRLALARRHPPPAH
jgi:thiamine kinase